MKSLENCLNFLLGKLTCLYNPLTLLIIGVKEDASVVQVHTPKTIAEMGDREQ